jgi:hypothetical protein
MALVGKDRRSVKVVAHQSGNPARRMQAKASSKGFLSCSVRADCTMRGAGGSSIHCDSNRIKNSFRQSKSNTCYDFAIVNK